MAKSSYKIYFQTQEYNKQYLFMLRTIVLFEITLNGTKSVFSCYFSEMKINLLLDKKTDKCSNGK